MLRWWGGLAVQCHQSVCAGRQSTWCFVSHATFLRQNPWFLGLRWATTQEGLLSGPVSCCSPGIRVAKRVRGCLLGHMCSQICSGTWRLVRLVLPSRPDVTKPKACRNKEKKVAFFSEWSTTSNVYSWMFSQYRKNGKWCSIAVSCFLTKHCYKQFTITDQSLDVATRFGQFASMPASEQGLFVRGHSESSCNTSGTVNT